MQLHGWMVVAALMGGLALPAWGQSLTVGLQLETPSVDPHFSISNPAVSAARHVFDTLAHPDARQRLHPGLAESWRAVSPTEWEYRLRPGVRFHDGAPLTAEDVAYSLRRAASLPNAPSGFAVMTRQITDIRVLDPLTLRVLTAAPFPLMSEHLSAVAIVSRAAMEGLSTAEINAGKGVVGSGPFRFVSWTRAAALRLARNDQYWDEKPAWAEVVFRPIADDGARVAALLAGNVDAIDLLPTASAGLLRGRADMVVAETVSNRLAFLGLNVSPAPNPLVTDAAGVPLARNPLADARVRRAISKAINRPALAERVMDGMAVPAAQLLPDGYPGTSAQLRPEVFDPEGARALLAEAGHAEGFGLVLLSPRDRGANDVKLAEAIAQMLARVGIRAQVEAMPWSMFQPRYMRADFAVGLRGWGTETGEVSMALRSILGTRDAARGWGMVNAGHYSNPAVDRMLEDALSTLAAPAREAVLAQASELALGETAIVPLHFQVAAWGMRRGIGYAARADSYSFAWEFRAAP